MRDSRKSVTSDEINQARDLIRKGRKIYKLQDFKCPVCEKLFRQQRRWQKFCSAQCRNGYHNIIAAAKLRK